MKVTRREVLRVAGGLALAVLPGVRPPPGKHRRAVVHPAAVQGEVTIMPGHQDVLIYVNPGTAASALASRTAASIPAPAPFAFGGTQPDATNTGPGVLGYTSATLTDVSPASPYVLLIDAAYVAANGAVLEGKRIHGIVEITASNVTVQGCEIVGRLNIPYPGSTHYGLVSSSGTGNTVQYCHLTQFDPSTGTDNSAGSASGTPTYWMVGVLATAGTCTVSRNNISDVNDCVYLTGGTHQVAGNYLHDNMFRTDDADQSGSSPPSWSHNDGVQLMGGTSHLIQGNTFEQRYSLVTGMNSTANPSPVAEQVWPNCHSILFASSNNTLTGITVDGNWFKYGACCAHFTTGSGTGTVTMTRNRFTPDQSKEFSVYTQIRVDPVSNWTVTVDATNVYSGDADTPSGDRGTTLKAPTGTTVKVWQYNASAHTP